MAPPATTIHLYRPPSQVDAHLNDYFINQMIHVISESAAHSLRTSSNAKRAFQERKRLQLGSASHAQEDDHPARIIHIQKNDLDEAYRTRMDAAGYKVGWSLAERLSRDKPRMSKPTPDPLEIMKFICKDIWTAMYNKQVDNLRTNHRGIYVIQDLSYRAFLRVSVPKGYESEMDEICKKVNQFKCASFFFLTYHNRLISIFFFGAAAIDGYLSIRRHQGCLDEFGCSIGGFCGNCYPSMYISNPYRSTTPEPYYTPRKPKSRQTKLT